MNGLGRSTLVMLAVGVFCWAAGLTAVFAQAPAENRYNEELLHMSPQEQASKLADHLGVWCIGTKPFYMGMTKSGRAQGYAYWSVTCAGGQSYMVQISPQGQGAAIDCKSLKEGGEGRECYKAF
jgi:hypothetical protein